MRTLTDLYQIAAKIGSQAKTPQGALRALRAHLAKGGTIYPSSEDAREDYNLRCAAKQRRRSDFIAAAIGDYPYAVSHSTWAGGDHTTTYLLGDTPAVKAGTNRAWSRNGKWRGTDSYAQITITRRALRTLGHQHLLIGGLITVDAVRVAPRVYRATWLEQSRGCSLKLVTGHIVRGYHVAGDNLQSALAAAKRARKKSVSALLSKRADRHALKRVYVTYEDSVQAGNCPQGTKAAQRQLDSLLGADGELGAVRADVLYELLPSRKREIARAVAIAAGRRATHV